MAYRSFMWRQNHSQQRALQRRREKVRKKLRDRGLLPPVGQPMTKREQEIYDQIGNDDYSFWNICKLNGDNDKLHNGGCNTNRHIIIQRTPEYLLWDRIRQSHQQRKKNIDFNITVDDIVIPLLCPITGNIISTDFNDRNKDNYFVLDRIDWQKGYVKDNVRVVSALGLSQKISELSKNRYFNTDPKDYIPVNIKKSLLSKAKRNAKVGNYDFDLTVDDIIISEYCPYLNIKLTFNTKDCRKSNYASIDRIDSTKGYVKGNIMVISRLANTMKNEASIDQLIVFSENVLKMYKS